MDNAAMEKLIQTAIGREVEAFRFYRDAAGKVANEAVREMFEELAKQEQEHEELLWKFKGDSTMTFKMKVPADFKIAETIVDLPELTTAMKPADAIALAMKKEQQAAEFYRQLATVADDASTREMLTNLVNMELTHKNRLETAFVNIGYPESF